jgi:hypothetical protein
MLPNWLNLLLTWFPVAALAIMAGIFILRRLYHELPFFFLYLVSALLTGVLRYAAVHFGPRTYFYSYWISDLIVSVIFLLPFYEVFLRRLFPRFYQVRLYRNLFPAVAALVLLAAIGAALQAADKGAAFQMASRGFDFMRTAVLTFLMLLMIMMGRNWPRYDFGIALGFGLQAAVALINSAVRTWQHHSSALFDNLEYVAYNIACLIWIITFWKPERPAILPPEGQMNAETLHQARKWEEALKDFLTQGKR